MKITYRGFVQVSRNTVALALGLVLLVAGFSFSATEHTSAAVTGTLYTTSQGFYNEWDGDESDIDESSNFKCNDDDYIRDDGGSGSNNDRETFNLDISSIPNGSVITDVEVITYSRDDNGGNSQNGQFRHLVRLDGTNFLSTGSPISPADDDGCYYETRTINVTDTVKSASTDLEIGVEKSNSSTKVRVGAIHAKVTYTAPDTTKPTVTINQKSTQIDPTSNSPIRFSVVFSESVSDFDDAGDVLLSGTAGATTFTINDNGDSDPKTYEVVVSGMVNSNYATVIASIPAGAAKDGSNNTSEASTSTDNEVTYHINVAPTATGESVTTAENVAVGIVLDAADTNGDVLTYIIVTPPVHGDLSGTAPNLTYTPDSNFHDTDSFTFKVNDGIADSNIATVNITVTEVCEANEYFDEELGYCVENEVDPPACDEGETWNGDYCAPNEEDEEQCVLVSDEQTIVLDEGVTENASILSFVHSGWATISGASWIWGDNPVVNPEVDETQVFTKTFSLEEVPDSATLTFASDNGYTVKVNGVEIASDTIIDPNPPHTFNPTTSVAVTNLIAGTNTLEITVVNKGIPGETNPQNNPAGLIYKLTINGSECGKPAPEPVCEAGVELLKNGSFENPSVTSGANWDIFPSGTTLGLEWIAEWLGVPSEGRPAVANIEIQKNGLYSGTAALGSQWTELDSDWNGHAEGPNNEAGAVAIYQDVPTVAGEDYTLSFKFSARPNTADTQNKVEALADGVVIGTAGPTAGTGSLNWGTYTFTFTATDNLTRVMLRDAGSPNDSFGSLVDDASLKCVPQEEGPTATLIATKIVCDDESYLPNWGAGGAPITAETAAAFLADVNEGLESPVCRIEPNWQFEWVTDLDSSSNPGDNNTVASGFPWSLFGFGIGNGTLTTDIAAGGKVWVREILKQNFVPFTGANTTEDVSAEMYCGTDVLNYDNWDWIDPVVEGETYYCVAFNAPLPEVDQCEENAEIVLLSNTGTNDETGPASVVAALHESWDAVIAGASWIWSEDPIADAASATSETFTKQFTIIGTPLDATLTIAADNTYSVSVNGTPVGSSLDEDNYTATDTIVIPANLLLNGVNTITFTVNNLAQEGGTPASNPAGLLYKLVVHENECVVPEELTSTVTMCKQDENGRPLSGWTLMLQGDAVESVNVAVNNPAGTNTVNVLDNALSYLAIASGTWDNQNGANPVDAEYSTTDAWVTPMDGYTGYSTDILELQINNRFDADGNNWGPYNPAHVYAQSFTPASDAVANFRIYDGHPVPTVTTDWYGDNINSTLNVALYEGYAGVTGEDGCVTFEDVPYGSYTATELNQAGWEYFATWDGKSATVEANPTVAVNGVYETFTIQNNDTSYDEEGYEEGTLIIKKQTAYEENGSFDFDIGGNESLYDADVVTNNGKGEVSINLPTGTYSVTETQQEDWEFISVSCSYEGESEGLSIPFGHQISIYGGETVTCTFINSYDEDGGGSGNDDSNDSEGGSVLGAATSEEQTCGPLLSTYMRMGMNNNEDEVVKLQDFLNGEMGSGLPITGIFGSETDAAVRAFQLKYWEEVLKPWFGLDPAIQDQDDSTGYVFKTTKWKINNLFCPGSEAMPTLP